MAYISPILEIIKKYNLMPVKGLGQNFLIDFDNDQIIKSHGDIHEESIILEIGPGPGSLTRELIKTKAQKVIAIEIDDRCIEALQEINDTKPDKRLEILHTNAMEFNYKDVYQKYGNKKLDIIANLPYNIGTKLLKKWFKELEIFNRITIMLQKEVVNKLSAQPGSKNYGKLAIITQTLSDIEVHFDIDPEHFYPPPKIISTLLTLKPLNKTRYLCNIKALENISNIAFSQRRKMIKKSLKSVIDNIDQTIKTLNISANARPEELTIEQFCALSMQ